jgi:hypothetical protein
MVGSVNGRLLKHMYLAIFLCQFDMEMHLLIPPKLYLSPQLAWINAFVSNLDIPFSARQLSVLSVPAAAMRSGVEDILR